jgi:D-aminopeptidase
MRARDLGLACGVLPTGEHNSIADVPGVLVGHSTLVEGDVRTGVTAVLPHDGDLFQDKPVAAAVVLNGFGKSIGLMQVNELGVLETPILLTNTFAVGTCANALIRRAIGAEPETGRQTATVNPVVLECNDGFLNDIQAMAVTEADVDAAIAAAGEDFAVGAVGAGTGMSCFGLKGGIGSASRRVRLDGATWHLGVLVLANFGRAGDLRLPAGSDVYAPERLALRQRNDPAHGQAHEGQADDGEAYARQAHDGQAHDGQVHDGRAHEDRGDPHGAAAPETGSCIVVMGTDIPLDHRQLRRVAMRAGVGLAWCGSFWGHGSGDIALAFTTANRVAHEADADLLEQRVLAEGRIDRLFQAAAEATQEAVLDALAAAETMVGRHGHRRMGLRETLGR